MHVRFADQVATDGVVRCARCDHEVIVRRGDAVPRCYCGGHEFSFRETGERRAAHAPRRERQRDPGDVGDDAAADA